MGSKNIDFNKIAVFDHNPFKPDYPGNDFRQYKELSKFGKGSFISEGGEIVEGDVAKQTERKVHDRTKFLKLYQAGINVIPGLRNPAIKFFKYILTAIMERQDTDYVIMPAEQTLTACGYSKTSRTIYYETIRELIDNKVISKKESYGRDQYWVNPNMFFNGDRVVLFKDFTEYFKAKNQ